jgi:hypothetical protein
MAIEAQIEAQVEAVLTAKFAALLLHLDERRRRLAMGAEARVLGRGGIKVPTPEVTTAALVRCGAKPHGALGDGELGIHSGDVMAGEVADQFVSSGRQGHGHPA